MNKELINQESTTAEKPENLRQRVQSSGPLPSEEVVWIAWQLAGMIDASSPESLETKRIAPRWLTVDEFGRVDWQPFEGCPGELREPEFCSPEELRGEMPGVDSHLYSLGVTLWYLSTGLCPFRGTSAKVIGGHLQEVPPFEELSEIELRLGDLIAFLLVKERHLRAGSGVEVMAEIERWVIKPPTTKAPASEQSRVFSNLERHGAHASEVALGALLAVLLYAFAHEPDSPGELTTDRGASGEVSKSTTQRP